MGPFGKFHLPIPLIGLAAIIMIADGTALAAGSFGEDCPQGRQIRAQKAYPSTITDCEVLDADTAARNNQIRRRAAAPTTVPAASTAQLPKVAIYRSRFTLAGYLLRAGTVCEDESKRTINAAFGLLATEQLKLVSKAYPATTEKWMTEGATTFNTEVMQNGIKSTCASSMSDRQHVEDASKAPAASAPAAVTAAVGADRSSKKPPKHNWVSVEANNGAVIKVDMNSIQRGDGAAIVFTYADEGNPEDAYKLQGYQFDCQGHYSLIGIGSTPRLYAPPRSVAARISELACSVPVGTVPK
jgi:hypothetical protein